MIKFLSTIGGALLCIAAFLYYLISNANFVPIDSSGNYITLNIWFLGFLLLSGFLCISILTIFLSRQFLLKWGDVGKNIKKSILYGILLTFGLMIIYILHFFHILGFLWGMVILIVVIISVFVI